MEKNYKMHPSYLLIGLSLFLLSGCKLSSGGLNTPPPLPADPGSPPIIASSRKGLYYGYYGAENNQISETLDHVNLLFEGGWDGFDASIDRMIKSGLPTIFTITSCVYTGQHHNVYLGKEIAQRNLRDLFDKLRQKGVLKNIVGLYPIDEPDLVNLSAEVVIQVNSDIREIIAEYNELKDCKLVVTYTGSELYPGIESYDIIGFDDYDMREKIFEEGNKYDRLRSKLREDQMLTLFPGGSDPWRTNPSAFYIKAQSDLKVWAIIPFIWFDNAGTSTNKGIRSNGVASWYSAYGRAIKNSK